MKRIRWLAPALLLLMAACGGGDDDSASGDHDDHGGDKAACAPAGPALKIAAKSVKFDEKCLAAPANQDLTLTLDNRDDNIPHNVAIFRDTAMSDRLYTGETFVGEKKMDYKIPPLQPGTYHFHCDVHPNMEGTFIVA